MSKLSVGVYGDQPRAELEAIIDAVQPVWGVLFFAAGRKLAPWVAARYPAVKRIARHYWKEDWHAQVIGESGNPRALGRDFADQVHSTAQGCNIYQCSNELCSHVRPAEWHAKFLEYDLGFIERCRELGVDPMCLNIARGNLDYGLASIGYYAEVARRAYVGYGMYTNGNVRAALDPEHAPYHELRWQEFDRVLRAKGVEATFVGREALHEPGWRPWMSEDQLIEDWLRYGEVIKGDRRVPVVCAFQVGHPTGWGDYSVGLRWARAMGEWNRANAQEEKMPAEIHVEGQIPNQEPRPTGAKIKRLMLHSTRSGRDWTPEQELSATINHFKNPQSDASAHLIQAANGDWVYCVGWARMAYGAEYLNPDSVHIELVQAKANIPFADIQMARLAEAAKWICGSYGIPLRRVMDENEAGIIGHEDTAQGKSQGKSDPGPMFPWTHFLGLIGAEPAIDWKARSQLLESRIAAANLKVELAQRALRQAKAALKESDG